MFLLIIKLIIDLIFFNKKEGINVFLLNDEEVKYYNLDKEMENDNYGPDKYHFPIFIGKHQI